MDKKIKNIVFDFGGVLVDLDKQRVIDGFARLGLDATPYIGTSVQGGLFQKMELGEETSEMFCENVRKLTKRPDFTDTQICEIWNSMLVGIPHRRLDALLALRRRYALFLLSNTNDLHWRFACNTMFKYRGFIAENYFQRIFLSYQMHLAKPDLKIFEAVLQQADIVPEDTIFIDDSEENCAAARRLGITTFCPKTPDEWLNLFENFNDTQA